MDAVIDGMLEGKSTVVAVSPTGLARGSGALNRAGFPVPRLVRVLLLLSRSDVGGRFE